MGELWNGKQDWTYMEGNKIIGWNTKKICTCGKLVHNYNSTNNSINQQILYYTNIFCVSLTTSTDIIRSIHEITNMINNQGIETEDSFPTTTEDYLFPETSGKSME